MRQKWEVTCEFKNGFMQEHGEKRTFSVTASSEKDARYDAKLEMCRKLGLSTMMHRYVSVQKIKSTGRA